MPPYHGVAENIPALVPHFLTRESGHLYRQKPITSGGKVQAVISKCSPVYKRLFIKLFKKKQYKKKNLGLSAAALLSAFIGAVRSTPQPPCRQYSFARQIFYGGFAGYLLPSPIPSAVESLLSFYHNITFGKVAAVLLLTLRECISYTTIFNSSKAKPYTLKPKPSPSTLPTILNNFQPVTHPG